MVVAVDPDYFSLGSSLGAVTFRGRCPQIEVCRGIESQQGRSKGKISKGFCSEDDRQAPRAPTDWGFDPKC